MKTTDDYFHSTYLITIKNAKFKCIKNSEEYNFRTILTKNLWSSFELMIINWIKYRNFTENSMIDNSFSIHFWPVKPETNQLFWNIKCSVQTEVYWWFFPLTEQLWNEVQKNVPYKSIADVSAMIRSMFLEEW